MTRAEATLYNDEILLRCDYSHKPIVTLIPGRRWDPVLRAWMLPLNAASVEGIRCIRGALIDEAVLERTGSAAQEPVKQTFEGINFTHKNPMPIKVTPYAHQTDAYIHAMKRCEFALLHEMGCGKSLTAIAVMGRRFLNRQICRVLVVAPLSVVPVWERELKQYADFPYTCTVLEGTGKQKAVQLSINDFNIGSHLSVMVVNYESAWRLEAELKAYAPDMIICDEAQRIKNPQARQSKALHTLGRAARYKLVLTGTPVVNSPLDYFSLYKFLDPRVFGNSFFSFRSRYAVMGGYGNHEIVGYRKMGELVGKVHAIAHRVTKAQALDLPPYTSLTHYCTLEADVARLYRRIELESIAALDEGRLITTPQVITRLLRLSQICGGYVKIDAEEGADARDVRVSGAKESLLCETLADVLGEGHKVVVFARFRLEIRDICEIAATMCGEDGYRAIHGDIPGSERGEAVRAFQEDAHVRVFVAQIQTAGLGVTLTAADTAIFYSLDYSYANYEQARARIHRAGQTRPCTCIHLIARGTVDEDVLEALERKRDVAECVVDKWREVKTDYAVSH